MDVLQPDAVWTPPPPPPDYRREDAERLLDPAGRERYRRDIERHDGAEVVTVWRWDDAAGWFTDPEVFARGRPDRCISPGPTAGTLLLHNHGNGDLFPSEADWESLKRFAACPGASWGIVNSEVTRLFVAVPGVLAQLRGTEEP